MNDVKLWGTVGRAPKGGVGAHGVPKVSFSLAVRKHKQKAIYWIQCESYGELAEIIRDNYGKGDFMLVTNGELQTKTFPDGKQFWVVRVRSIEFSANLKTRKSKAIIEKYGYEDIY